MIIDSNLGTLIVALIFMLCITLIVSIGGLIYEYKKEKENSARRIAELNRANKRIDFHVGDDDDEFGNNDGHRPEYGRLDIISDSRGFIGSFYIDVKTFHKVILPNGKPGYYCHGYTNDPAGT